MAESRPRKYFGQHFLHDRNIIDKIIAGIGPQPEDWFVEIGPGRGALTTELLKRSARVDAVEIDRDLARQLEKTITDPGFKIHQADALKFDFSSLGNRDGTLRLAGNLPYNISSPLLFHILATASLFSDIHVMLQKEVVSRMAAAPGSRIYGRLTVALAARCRVEPLFDIRPGSFTPPPKVDSTFVRLIPNPAQLAKIDNEAVFDELLRRAFGMRRKRLSNAVRGLLTEEQIAAAGVDPGVRAEKLDVDAFVALANLCTLPSEN
jgi:16S rRNA (adenine1518-N6/adenine1519-N6)-dimethyltransferase